MPKLLEQVRDLIRTRHYSYRTEEAYLNWIRQYILFQRCAVLWLRVRLDRSRPGSSPCGPLLLLRVMRVSPSTVVLFNLQFWSLSDSSVTNAERNALKSRFGS